jgi:hypothetical protein
VPFTGSHPAAVLPLIWLTRGRLALAPSALVVGSMVPDLPYFAPLPLERRLTHQLTGVLTVDIALGLAVLLAWHALLAPAAVALAPDALRARLGPGGPATVRTVLGTPRAVVGAAVSLVVGALTHVGWDAFTHPDGWGVLHVQWLASSEGRLNGYRWAQYLSGISGLAVLAGWAVRRWRRTAPVHPPRTRVPAAGPVARTAALATVALPATVVGLTAGLPAVVGSQTGPHLGLAAFHAVTRGGSVAVLCAVAVAVALRLRRARPAV